MQADLTQVTVCTEDEIARTGRELVVVKGTPVAVFKVGTRYYAVRNVCPHKGAPLFWGRVSGTLVPSEAHEYVYGMEDQVLRCPWHKWEYDLDSGCLLTNKRVRLRTFPVTLEDGDVRIEV